MGRLDLRDIVRDEDLTIVSAHDLCKTRLCTGRGCPNTLGPNEPELCGDCVDALEFEAKVKARDIRRQRNPRRR
jgi:hypothetical protein